MADLFIVGRYDDVASTTAVSIGSQIMQMIAVMIVGLAMGTTGNTTSSMSKWTDDHIRSACKMAEIRNSA